VPHSTVHVGDIEISALLDVEVSDEPIVEGFPDAPADGVLGAKAAYPSVYGEGETWHLFVRTWLVRHPGGVLLFDTGVGPATSPTMAWCSAPGSTMACLREVNSAPDEIDLVVLSHAHDDHIGGVLATDGSPAFPRARYLLQRADHEWLRRIAREDEEQRSVFEGLLQPLDAAGVLDLLDGDRRLSDGMIIRHAPGHTPGHQVIGFEGGGTRALLSADTWNHPMQLEHPEWPSGLDDDHATAEATRRTMLTELLAEPDTLVAPTHFGEPFGRIVRDANLVPVWAPRT
jgi:glyoxylase-like metal-dependent hydrolase (beta-lactamase superfamily II)